MEKTLQISVIVTTKNEGKVIRHLLRSLKKQSFKNFEVILVDNNSQDETLDIAKKMRVKTFNFGPERSAQRNFGVTKARGTYIIFLDADMELSEKVLDECIKIYSSKKNLGGIIIPEESVTQNFWERVKGFERSFYNFSGDKITDAARFFLRSVFFRVGGFDETITGPEDWDLTENIRKKGYKIDRINSKILHHERIPSLFSLAKKKFYYGLNAYRYMSKHNIAPISSKTIYFLRPAFYKQWKKLLSNPTLTVGMIVMFVVEIISGGFGYVIGRIKAE